jgi:hypothetical protein
VQPGIGADVLLAGRGHGGGPGGAQGADRLPVHGRAVQVEPIKPVLKAPGIKLLNLKYDKPLFKICF